MFRKRIKPAVAGLLLILLLIAAYKLQLFEIASAKVSDIVSNNLVINYGELPRGGTRAVVRGDRKQLAYCSGNQEFFVRDVDSQNITRYETKDRVYQVNYSP